jgi:hypothetical protein
VRLDAELAERLEKAAADRGLTVSDILRIALEEHFAVGPAEIDDERVLQVLAERASRGNVAAARELLRHRRWEAERRRDDREHGRPDALDALRARRRGRLNGGVDPFAELDAHRYTNERE